MIEAAKQAAKKKYTEGNLDEAIQGLYATDAVYVTPKGGRLDGSAGKLVYT